MRILALKKVAANVSHQRIYPALRYQDATAAVDWLGAVLGFAPYEVIKDDRGTVVHAELQLEGDIIMLGAAKPDEYGKSPKDLGGVTSTVYFALDQPSDVDARFERAKAAGATITRAINDTEYGSHEFAVRDPEGHVWTFGTYRPIATS